MKFAVAALLATTVAADTTPAADATPAAGMSEEDQGKCGVAILTFEMMAMKAALTTEIAWIGEGFGLPDLMAIEKSDCMTKAGTDWAAIKVAAVAEADYAGCEAKLKTADAKAYDACWAKPEK